MATALVVGVGPGLGWALARRFAREGYDVGLIARSAEKVRTFTAELASAGVRAFGRAADAGDSATLGAEVTSLAAALGGVDVLLYNAAAYTQGSPSALPPEALVSDLRVDAVGALAAAQAVLPGMLEQGKGTILFTGGAISQQPSVRYLALGVGKSALRYLALSLHEEVKSAGVLATVMTIQGGIGEGGNLLPDRIADAYWAVHVRDVPARGEWVYPTELEGKA